MAEVVSARLNDDLLSRVDDARGEATRGAWLLEVITREVSGGGAAPGARSIGPGVPCPGVMCMWQRCDSRDSDRHGVTSLRELERRNYAESPRDEDAVGLALCKHHAAILEGRTYRPPRRELPPAWRKRQPEPA